MPMGHRARRWWRRSEFSYPRQTTFRCDSRKLLNTQFLAIFRNISVPIVYSATCDALKKHIGSDFDEFLNEQGLIEEVSAAALKRVIAWQLAEAMKAQRISKKALAERMHTSRTAVDRALDQNDAGMTLATLASAARALGQRV